MTTFQLPKDGAIYTDSIFDRCRDLVSYEVWAGIELHRLDTWISNFVTNEERYFGARVLDNLIYRSGRQTIALMKQMFHRVLPDLSRTLSLPGTLQNIYTSLQNTSHDPGLRLVPVIPPLDPPTKSGTVIARMLRRKLNFCERWIIRPDEVPDYFNQVEAFIFIDDFLGTGLQFSDFLIDTGLDQYPASTCCVYAPLAAHPVGKTRLQKDYDSLYVDTVELLDEHHALFDEKAGSFPDGTNSCEIAREFYYTLMRDREIDITGPDRRGFGHFELAYAFEHAVPDNSLPILWWPDSPRWKPLFRR